MSNTYDGVLEVCGDPDEVARFTQAVSVTAGPSEFLAATVPEPDYGYSGSCPIGPARVDCACETCWSEWRLENWGVKRPYEIKLDSEGSWPHRMRWRFETPWNAPLEWAIRTSERFPELIFILDGSDDEGGCSSDIAVCHRGECIRRDTNRPSVGADDHPWYPHYWAEAQTGSQP